MERKKRFDSLLLWCCILFAISILGFLDIDIFKYLNTNVVDFIHGFCTALFFVISFVKLRELYYKDN